MLRTQEHIKLILDELGSKNKKEKINLIKNELTNQKEQLEKLLELNYKRLKIVENELDDVNDEFAATQWIDDLKSIYDNISKIEDNKKLLEKVKLRLFGYSG